MLLRNFTSSPAYFRHEGNLPLVSALEGAKNAADWVNIKKRISGGLFFVPNWASLDVETAVKTASGVVDGLFNFRAWPNGTADMTTDVDRSYLAALGRNQVYMMAVSPWFYANQLGFRGQNWLWQGDGLWDLRCKSSQFPLHDDTLVVWGRNGFVTDCLQGSKFWTSARITSRS